MFNKDKLKNESKWNFVKAERGSGDKGINNPGIHSYSSDPIKNLAREICQNSLDAILTSNGISTTNPVKIEFNDFTLSKDEFPERNRLEEVYKAQIDYYKKIKEQDTTEVEFFKRALNVIKKDEIEGMRISDFNTKGLTGSEKKSGGDWYNLVKGVGISDKESTAGGSFGIGKHAAYAISKLYQVFYATIDMNKTEAFQGVTLLSSFEDKDGEYREGRGYYGYKDNYAHVNQWQSLDPDFTRDNHDSGTDIFIVGTELNGDWKQSVIIAVLENFMVSILENKLVVKVGDQLINHETAKKLIYDLANKTENGYLYEYFLAYQKAQEFNRVFYYTLLEENDVELRLLFNDDDSTIEVYNRTVSMTRKNGMKIFDKKRNPRVEFSGVLILRGDKVNSFFRELETPQHDKWSADMVKSESKSVAEKRKKELYKFINDKINDFIEENLDDEINAEGLSDFLPEVDPEEGSGKVEEALSRYRVNILKKDGKTLLKHNEASGEETGTETHKPGGSPDPKGDINVPGEGEGRGGGRRPRIPGFESDNDYQTVNITPTKPKRLKILKSKKGYRVKVILEKKVEQLNMEFKYLGETGKGMNFDINKVVSDIPFGLERNAVKLTPEYPQDNFSFEIITYNTENWSLEVMLNEIQSK